MESADFRYDSSNFFQDIVMTWMFPVIRYYHKIKPTLLNLLPIPNKLKYEIYLHKLETEWDEEKQKESPSFFMALLRVIGKDLLCIFLIDGIAWTALLIQCLLLIQVIDFIENPDYSQALGYLYSAIFILLNIIISLLLNYTIFRLHTIITSTKAIITQTLYKKILRLDLKSSHKADSGNKIISLISSDIELLDSTTQLMFLFSFPLFMIVSTIIMIVYFGLAGILGILAACIQIPIMYFLSKPIEKYREKIASISDQRIKLITSLIEGIRIVKLYGWESPFLNKVFAVRRKQIETIARRNIFIGLTSGIGQGGLAFVLLMTFGTYLWLGNTLRAGDVFAGSSVLYLAFIELNYLLPEGLIQFFLTLATMKRITESMMYHENSNSYTKDKDTQKTENSQDRLEGAFQLQNINIDVDKELTVIMGKVGCGKSVFLLALMKESKFLNFSQEIIGSISYTSDQPWIFPGTVRENIIIGSAYDPLKYSRVVNVCCLHKDFEQFKNGDLSLIADLGYTISGGQRARISLARALYKDSDIYLLDDPLSALDIEVGKRVLCGIKEFLIEKTVIISTHQGYALHYADKILIMEDGSQIFYGDYEAYSESENMNLHISDEAKVYEDDYFLKEYEEDDLIIEQTYSSPPLSLYYKFLKFGTGSHLSVISVIILMVSLSVINSAVLWWIAYWTDSQNQSDPIFTLVVLGFIISLIVIGYAKSIYFSQIYLKSTEKLHNCALRAIAESPVVFFDLNPTGPLNDEILYQMIPVFLDESFEILRVCISISIIVPYNIPVFAALIVYQYFFIKYISPTVKELRGHDLISRGPVISIINSTLHGLSTIRCHNLEETFISKSYEAISTNMQAYFTYNTVMIFYRAYTEISSTFINLVNLIIILLLRGSINSVLAGLSLALNISMMGLVNVWSKNLIEISNYISSAQRLFEYSDLPDEGARNLPSTFAIQQGRIEFLQVCLRYRPQLPLALKGLSMTVRGGTTLGIMGRTGAGKSTIMSALLRTVEIESGRILLDGENYMNLGLNDLRSQISVIPQSPIIFLTSIRSNLDPFSLHSDLEVEEALRNSRLLDVVKKFNKGVDAVYGEEGHFSTGQKQLLCLARALLKNSKILVIDEATANVDKDSEEMIQQQIRNEAHSKTVLIIAHRVSTIQKCDNIAIIDDGKCVEFGEPSVLEETSSYYKNILRES